MDTLRVELFTQTLAKMVTESTQASKQAGSKQSGTKQGRNKYLEIHLVIHVFCDSDYCVVGRIIPNRHLLMIKAVGTDPRARYALIPHKHGFYCEMLEYGRWMAL